ncbi:dihydroorotase [Caldibacillus lycopersici]|uniref:Dihydroorotase n=1 Tax=Perspicuibacillus lycopersici TaxID=1325689 RepID=A0AAE3LPB4_9BACI|nr:dihydroorotase [Perspicuibacillus lycopersici]MCU9612174.1 dihydroorotase [Perspicuibacillus lycopersici]
MSLLIKNGSLLNQAGELEVCDLYLEEGIIKKIASNIQATGSEKVIEAAGLLVSPGFVDLHVHLREPGGEQKETIATGTLAAAKGGFTTIASMPNTKPVPDTKEQLEWLHKRIKETAKVRVLPYATITKGQRGTELVDFPALAEANAFAFSDDGVGVQAAGVMYEAMKEAANINKAIVAHCEDNSLIYSGAVHEGKIDKELNIPGIPSIAESVQIARDILLAEAANCHYHVCHISTKESVRVVRDAKRAGIKVTAEVSPHHLLLCEDDIPGDDANFKMNPPLRSKEDKAALLAGLMDGTIDFIATDHAPHTEEDKQKGMRSAPFGIVGLETAFPLLYTNLVEKEILTLKELVDFMTIKPANAFQLPFGKLAEGEHADIVLVDLKHEATIDPAKFASKGKNTPFTNWNCKGWPVQTIVNGEIVWEKESVQQ